LNLKCDNIVKDVIEELIIILASYENNIYEKVIVLIDKYDLLIPNIFNIIKESLKITNENYEILKGFFKIIKAL